MLHRRFLYTDPSFSHLGAKEEQEDPYAYSRTACVDASLRTLELQHVLDEATRPGGQLHALRWRVTSSMNHQFLTATMVLCSLVHRGRTLNREADIVAALQRARTIVSEVKHLLFWFWELSITFTWHVQRALFYFFRQRKAFW